MKEHRIGRGIKACDADFTPAKKIDRRATVECKATVDVDLTKLLNRVAVLPDSPTLDIATGVGTIPALLGSHVVALDVSIEILREGKKIRQARWVCGDACTMPFRKDAFDSVTIFAGLMFIAGVRNKTKTLAECFRVLKGGGKLVLVEPEIQDPQLDLPVCFEIWWKGKHVGNVGVGTAGEDLEQSIESIKKALQDVGFSTIVENLYPKYFELVCKKTTDS